ncbi:MAG: endonuclease MutS2 [Desulfovibrio sp.]|uniref:endonuclease MutS2 n=1 Tax=Desulfovibrio sp. TaxID=885 RepID=UPI001A7C6B44|nr:Smr/MutS family protein [Desulfovibrio sp.]MBD5417534.1 endonuclease MutS2 [Desulfovibrio sp.]
MIHPRTLQALEFDKIIAALAQRCISAPGRALAEALKPLPDAAAAHKALKIYEEAALWAATPEPASGRPFALAGFPDVSGLLQAAQGGTAAPHRALPDTEAFWALRELLRAATKAHTSITVPDAARKWPLLLELAEERPLPAQLTAALNRCISDDALLKDESSPELYRLRSEVRRLHQSCLRKVKDFARQYNLVPYLQDDFMTLSSDRYVLPLKANFKGRVQGIIHDWSQTGETCYFEPLFLVEINNRLQELKHEEREEERKVLAYLRDLLVSELPGAEGALALLAKLDLLQAKRRLAEALDARPVPLTPAEEGIALAGARHPLLVLARQGLEAREGASQSGKSSRPVEPVRPLDIILRPGERVLVITGANAGGKTVCLKTLGLIAAMTMSGLPAPAASGSHLPWFERMDAFIGDEQSLDGNVSTFTAQIDHLAKAWKHLDAQGLVLLDEFGAGTDPAQGAALAQAVLDGLLDKRCFALSATHFPALKSYALTREGVRAASMLFDPATRRPLYALAYDQVGASQALDAAREHGLPEDILRRAEHYLLQDGQDTTALLARLNELAAQREAELGALKKEREAAHNAAAQARERLEKERTRLHDETRRHAAELMRAWKEGRATAKQSLKEMSRLRASLAPAGDAPADSVLPEAQALSVGQEVFHTVFNKRGVVTDVDERRGRVRLDMNGVILWAERRDLREAAAPGAGKAAAGPVRAPSTSPRKAAPAQGETATMRLDVRGQRAPDAIAATERFLDKALRAGFSELEIVHGRGTGALRRELQEFLRAHPAVASATLAPEDRGGDGMTIVVLR